MCEQFRLIFTILLRKIYILIIQYKFSVEYNKKLIVHNVILVYLVLQISLHTFIPTKLHNNIILFEKL